MLKEKLYNDLKVALKERNGLKTSTIRFVLAEVKNKEIDKRGELGDDEVLKVLNSVAKKHQDSISQFQAGGRADLVETEQAELAIIKTYLPEPLSREQVKTLVEQTISKLGAKDIKDLGRVIGAVMAASAGRAPGGIVSQIAQEQLSKSKSS